MELSLHLEMAPNTRHFTFLSGDFILVDMVGLENSGHMSRYFPSTGKEGHLKQNDLEKRHSCDSPSAIPRSAAPASPETLLKNASSEAGPGDMLRDVCVSKPSRGSTGSSRLKPWLQDIVMVSSFCARARRLHPKCGAITCQPWGWGTCLHLSKSWLPICDKGILWRTGSSKCGSVLQMSISGSTPHIPTQNLHFNKHVDRMTMFPKIQRLRLYPPPVWLHLETGPLRK